MSEAFIGEIKMFAGSRPPQGYAFCDGQLLAISQNDALFSLFGTIYGGNGRTTFGLPDLRGRIPLHQGRGPGLSNRRLGSKGGAETVTLTVNQLPSHRHTVEGSTNPASDETLDDHVLAESKGGNFYNSSASTAAQLENGVVANTRGSQPHNNMMPTQCIHFIVALVGAYPLRP